MKRVLLVMVLCFILGTMLYSCRSKKPPCPAYRTNKLSQIENIRTGIDLDLNVSQTENKAI